MRKGRMSEGVQKEDLHAAAKKEAEEAEEVRPQAEEVRPLLRRSSGDTSEGRAAVSRGLK
jgi:hypothetical protein